MAPVNGTNMKILPAEINAVNSTFLDINKFLYLMALSGLTGLSI